MPTQDQPAAPTTPDKELQKRLIFAWLDALRSGQWKQGKYCLEDSEGARCCLGVACRVGIEHGVGLVVDKRDSCTFFSAADKSLPEPMWVALRMRHREGHFDKTFLSAQNDLGKTFPEIAELIEQNARDLFYNGDEVAAWIQERKAAQS